VVEADRAARPAPEPTRILLRPKAVNETGFTVEPDPAEEGAFIVRGAKPERWVRQTDFQNDEAVGYLGDRLARLGVEEELTRRGAMPGAAVTIGEVTFDWAPSSGAEEEYLATRRGEDLRVDTSHHRTRAEERLAAKKARREHVEVPDEWSE
jgi:GTP-binding protein